MKVRNVDDITWLDDGFTGIPVRIDPEMEPIQSQAVSPESGCSLQTSKPLVNGQLES